MVFDSDDFLLSNLSFDEYCDEILFEKKLNNSYEIEINEDLPWADIMRQLEITVSGNAEDDFNNILDEIHNKIRCAKSKYDMNYYKWLVEHTYRVFMSLDNNYEEYKYSDFILDSEFEEFVNFAAS